MPELSRNVLQSESHRPQPASVTARATESLCAPTAVDVPQGLGETIIGERTLHRGVSFGFLGARPVIVISDPEVAAKIITLVETGSPQRIHNLALATEVRKDSRAAKLFTLPPHTLALLRKLHGEHVQDKGRTMRATLRMFHFLSGRIQHLGGSPVHLAAMAPFSRRLPCVVGDAEPELITTARRVLDQAHATANMRQASFGLRTEEMRRLMRADKSLVRFTQALELWSSGASIAEVCETFELSTRTLSGWLKGELPEDLAALHARPTTGRKGTLATLALPQSESVDWAYFLGTYQAVTMHRGSASGPRFVSPFFDQIASLAACIERLDLGVNVKTGHLRSHQQSRAFCRVANKNLGRFLISLSNDNERVVWEALGTPEEEIAYLRGWLSLRGALTGKGLQLRATQHPELLPHLAAVFHAQGIHAAVSFGKSPGIFISAASSLQRLHELNLLRPEMQRELGTQLSRMNPPTQHTRESFLRVEQYFRDNPGGGYSAAASATGIPSAVIREWRLGHSKPRVEWLKEMSDLSIFNVPNRGVIAYLYRTFGKPYADTAALGARITMEQVRAAEQLRSRRATVVGREFSIFCSCLEKVLSATPTAQGTSIEKSPKLWMP